MKFSTNQQLVFNESLKRLENKPWFKGVCCDEFPSEEYCQAHFDDAVSSITFKTAMWDNPSFYGG